MKCLICNKDLKNLKGISVHLNKIHNITIKSYYDMYLKKENEGFCYYCNKPAKFININKGYAKICDSNECLSKTRATTTYQFYMYKYNLSKNDAIKLVNEKAKERGLKIKKSLNDNFLKNKNFFKEKSTSSIEYWIKRGFTEIEAKEQISKIQKNNSPLCVEHWINKGFTKIEAKEQISKIQKTRTSTNIEYWINKGFSEDESNEKLKNRQNTFTLKKCIEKYGKDDGIKIYEERQKNWSKKIEEKYRNGDFSKTCKQNSSIMEINFFKIIVDKMNLSDDKYYSGINGNQFFRTFKEINKTFSYDFVYNNKIIEFNGKYYHCDKRLYEKDYFNKIRKMTAQEIWDFDDLKINLIKKCGFEIMIVCEYDFKNNPEKVIEECITFLKNK